MTTFKWPRYKRAPRGKISVARGWCIIVASFYHTSKPSINAATRVCALATKAAEYD